ncbi:DUF6445 family protein [Aquimonas sp.]|uniref:DUF6445 family protein n=1 Tax=Aquimonas sp. TaxID=1872588 RepID=UPI0037C165DE
MFNPNPSRQLLPLHDGQVCLVFDDVLAEPERLVALAEQHRADFVEAPWNAYPGPELALSAAITARLVEFFNQHARSALGARRTLRAHSRLALVTRAPEQLSPPQWICHRDRLSLEPSTCVAASVLYLFDQAALGGTAFYRPLRPPVEMDRLLYDSGRLPAADFRARYDLQPGYMTAGNAWFERVACVAPRYNRLIVYRGDLFHSGDIHCPERLDPDPRRGRLSLNGFFTCRAAVGPLSPG